MWNKPHEKLLMDIKLLQKCNSESLRQQSHNPRGRDSGNYCETPKLQVLLLVILLINPFIQTVLALRGNPNSLYQIISNNYKQLMDMKRLNFCHLHNSPENQEHSWQTQPENHLISHGNETFKADIAEVVKSKRQKPKTTC